MTLIIKCLPSWGGDRSVYSHFNFIHAESFQGMLQPKHCSILRQSSDVIVSECHEQLRENANRKNTLEAQFIFLEKPPSCCWVGQEKTWILSCLIQTGCLRVRRATLEYQLVPAISIKFCFRPLFNCAGDKKEVVGFISLKGSWRCQCNRKENKI